MITFNTRADWMIHCRKGLMFCIQMMSELITIQKQFLAKTVEMSLWPAAQVALVDAVASKMNGS